jgi:hypothetical protein
MIKRSDMKIFLIISMIVGFVASAALVLFMIFGPELDGQAAVFTSFLFVLAMGALIISVAFHLFMLIEAIVSPDNKINRRKDT